MKVYLGADHAGFRAKERIKRMLDELEINYEDLGAHTYNKSDDYPDIAFAVAEKVAKSKGRARGVLICGSGVGVDVVANKVKGIRSVLATTSYMANQGVSHDHANVLSLAARVNSQRQMQRFVRIFLRAKPSNVARHRRRVKKIIQIESTWSKLSRRS